MGVSPVAIGLEGPVKPVSDDCSKLGGLQTLLLISNIPNSATNAEINSSGRQTEH